MAFEATGTTITIPTGSTITITGIIIRAVTREGEGEGVDVGGFMDMGMISGKMDKRGILMETIVLIMGTPTVKQRKTRKRNRLRQLLLVRN